MHRFELTTGRPERARLLRSRPSREIWVHDDAGHLVMTTPAILRTTRRAEYPLSGDLAGGAKLVRTSWSRFALVDQQTETRFVMRAPRPGRKMRPSWEIRPASGRRIVLVSNVPFSTIEGLARDFRNDILATYRSEEGFRLDVYPTRGELTVDHHFGASLRIAAVAAVIARALHSNPTP